MTRLIAALFVVGLALVATGGPQASDAPRELKWAQLIPPDAREKPKTLKPFFGQRPSSPAALKEDPNIPEAQWMSQPLSQRPGDDAPLVADFDGERVRIGGYVVPLDFEATSVTEFLLVPFVGACIHVPPPPRNQLIYVKAASGFTVTDLFDPVYVTGTMQAKAETTELAEAGYTIVAEAVDLRKQ